MGQSFYSVYTRIYIYKKNIQLCSIYYSSLYTKSPISFTFLPFFFATAAEIICRAREGGRAKERVKTHIGRLPLCSCNKCEAAEVFLCGCVCCEKKQQPNTEDDENRAVDHPRKRRWGSHSIPLCFGCGESCFLPFFSPLLKKFPHFFPILGFSVMGLSPSLSIDTGKNFTLLCREGNSGGNPLTIIFTVVCSLCLLSALLFLFLSASFRRFP